MINASDTIKIGSKVDASKSNLKSNFVNIATFTKSLLSLFITLFLFFSVQNNADLQL